MEFLRHGLGGVVVETIAGIRLEELADGRVAGRAGHFVFCSRHWRRREVERRVLEIARRDVSVGGKGRYYFRRDRESPSEANIDHD